MHCPDCKKAMLILEYKDIEVDFCPHCKGCWLDEGELEQVLQDRDAALRVMEGSSGRTGKRRCPRCAKKMHVVPLPDADGTEIDLCPAACGMWFEQGELREVVRAQLPDPVASGITKTLTEMFGTMEKF